MPRYIPKVSKIQTLSDLLVLVQREKLPLDTKVYLSKDEEGNAFYGLAEYDYEPGSLILYPYNSPDFELVIDDEEVAA